MKEEQACATEMMSAVALDTAISLPAIVLAMLAASHSTIRVMCRKMGRATQIMTVWGIERA